uniref:Transmembrane protein (PGPGW) n=1 Tax=Caulobacter sp. (strain K31) TaxID=366602 RepID=B0T012_CAUSK
MNLALAMPPVRFSAADELARELLGRISRVVLVTLGLILIVAGFIIAPLPGPLGVPVTVVGLMLVLRNSFKARKHFVRFQHAHPKLLFPLRRLLRREPEVLPVAWQQVLRMERLVVPRRWHVAKRWRKSAKRRSFRRQFSKTGP